MEGFNAHTSGGSLQISSEVIEKIAQQATMEVEGVAAVRAPAAVSGSLLGKLTATKPIRVAISNEVADVEVCFVVKYGAKIPEISEKVQQNVKSAIQNMTSITVGHVDVIITGITAEAPGGSDE